MSAPPEMVSRLLEPTMVAPPPLLLSVQPPLPPAAATLMANPAASTLALPLLELALLAVQAAASVALTAPVAVTTNMSVPPAPRSVMVSVPDATLK